VRKVTRRISTCSNINEAQRLGQTFECKAWQKWAEGVVIRLLVDFVVNCRIDFDNVSRNFRRIIGGLPLPRQAHHVTHRLPLSTPIKSKGVHTQTSTSKNWCDEWVDRGSQSEHQTSPSLSKG